MVPHLAAKCVESEQQLREILRDCGSAGIAEVFAIGGDAAKSAGPYGTGGELLRAIVDITDGQLSVGVAGQMCFSGDSIHSCVELLRQEGVHLPVIAIDS